VNEPQPPTFFVDWCFGKTIVAALHKAGAKVEHHGDHFAPETPDTLWLPTVGQRGWIVLTKDNKDWHHAARIQRDRPGQNLRLYPSFR